METKRSQLGQGPRCERWQRICGLGSLIPATVQREMSPAPQKGDRGQQLSSVGGQSSISLQEVAGDTGPPSLGRQGC